MLYSAAGDSFITTPSPDPSHKFVFLSKSVEPAFMDLTKSFSVVTSETHLVYFVPQRDVCMLCCEHGTELIITRIRFYQICAAVLKCA